MEARTMMEAQIHSEVECENQSKMVCLLILVICYTFKSNNDITIKYKWRIIFPQEFILNLVNLSFTKISINGFIAI